METMQIVIDKKLLGATDRAARRAKRNRSALVPEALRQHLRRLHTQEMEERDLQGYAAHPELRRGAQVWEAEAGTCPPAG